MNHAYVWVPGTDTLLKVDKTVDMHTYQSGVWTNLINSVPGSSTLVGTGSNYTCMERPYIWMMNDQGYPVSAANVGQLCYLTTGEHVGTGSSDLNTACIAGEIVSFDSTRNIVLVNFNRKSV
jgi:hypothetical protein